MKLTGKCKKDFEQSDYFKKASELFEHDFYFYDIPFTMQYGVYVDFFGSIDECKPAEIMDNVYDLYVYEDKTLHEARTEAIKKENEIYNANRN